MVVVDRPKDEMDSASPTIGSLERIIRVQIRDDLPQINLDNTGDVERLINYLVGSIEECQAVLRKLSMDA